MSLPADGVNANTLAETITIPTGKKLIFLDPDTNEGGIITLENLTKQILSNLTSQTFNLDQGNKTLLAALNELNSKSFSLAANSNNTLTLSDNLNADFETFSPRTISIRRFSNGVPGQPGERGNGVLFTYKDAANYGWSIAVINGNIYTRKIADGNIEDWKSIATK